jgi:hypothetical protein
MMNGNWGDRDQNITAVASGNVAGVDQTTTLTQNSNHGTVSQRVDALIANQFAGRDQTNSINQIGNDPIYQLVKGVITQNTAVGGMSNAVAQRGNFGSNTQDLIAGITLNTAKSISNAIDMSGNVANLKQNIIAQVSNNKSQ